jgi:pilus assembly protein Flp/PilA
MIQLSKLSNALLNDESGQDLIEYALLAAMIAIAAIGTVKTLSNTIFGEFSYISSKLSSAL